MRFTSKTVAILAALLCCLIGSAQAVEPLVNEFVRAEFAERGLTGLMDLLSGRAIHLENETFAVDAGGEPLASETRPPTFERETATSRIFRWESPNWIVRATYELQPGWRFISKQLRVEAKSAARVRIGSVEVLRGEVVEAITRVRPRRDGALLRLRSSGEEPETGVFLAVQNPFVKWSREESRIALTYAADMGWDFASGPFLSDRLCLGVYPLSGQEYPLANVPEWRFVPAAARAARDGIDWAEVSALSDCARAFLLVHPKAGERVHVGWCENDFQIDAATPEGQTEYQRIIDQAAAFGCQRLLYSPANSALSSLAENRDAWAWENVLWFGLGQRIRKGEWVAGRDPVPASVRAMLDYGRTRGVQLVSYIYPSLPFLQDPAWTKWIPKGKVPGGYLGADTGERSFQDWLVAQLVQFAQETGAGGFSFDHWWIAYDEATSPYAQWAGCRRVLEELRARLPDTLIDGRQQYHQFGVWSWLAGSYPHPLASDEQPQSFRAFPDLHIDRVTADRQRSAAWGYRVANACPVELMPGFIGHQTPRLDEKNTVRRDRFRTRDWDYLGWRYSLLSSIATAPFHHVVNMLPARDPEELAHFPEADKKWFRDWLDWSDANLERLRHVRPILGQPMLGQVDGTAACEGERGFVFLFNPNYRALPAEFVLDGSIGLTAGKDFTLRQLYPEVGKGQLLAPAKGVFWHFGDHVKSLMPGAEALVLQIEPAPENLLGPLLLSTTGTVTWRDGALEINGAGGEPGSVSELRVLLPKAEKVRAISLNGLSRPFAQTGATVTTQARFAGERFAKCQAIGGYDPAFEGGFREADFTVPNRILQQLAARKRSWPIAFTDQEKEATWLAPERLLLFINIAEPSDKMEVQLSIDGHSVELRRAYTSILPQVSENTFVGWYADLSVLAPDVSHHLEAVLPAMTPGQFQGFFFENVEAESTEALQP